MATPADCMKPPMRCAPTLSFCTTWAECSTKRDAPADAAGYYERYLAAGAEGSETNRRKTEQFLEQARKEAGIATPTIQGRPLAQSCRFPRPNLPYLQRPRESTLVLHQARSNQAAVQEMVAMDRSRRRRRGHRRRTWRRACCSPPRPQWSSRVVPF